MKKLLYIIMCTILAWNANAEIPAGYYNGLDGKSQGELKTAACSAITPHTQLSYSQLWTAFRYTDVRPAPNNDQWWDMYSYDIFYVANGSTGLNREHSFPKSWWGGDQNSAYTDLNHLYPSESKANTAKNNYPLGMVATTTFDNNCSKVGYPVNRQGGGAKYVYEPADEYKGDFARTYFYMATMYQNLTWKYTYMLDQNLYPTLKPWAYEMLMAWHRADPVDQKELDRNEAVYSRQGNRNPFIDLPQLAEYLWGDKAGQTFHIDGTPTEGDAVLLTPSEGSTIDFGEVAIGRSVTLSILIKGENISTPISVKITDEGTKQAQYFTAAVTSISAVSANTAEGYALPIKYAPKKMGNHSCKITLSGGGLPRAYSCTLTGNCLATPTLSILHATEATDITADAFTANWDVPDGETIDYYVVTLTAADGTTSQTISDENQCRFENLPAGYKYNYYVQSHRLGYVSQPSNVITVDCSSVTGISADQELNVHSGDGEIIFYTGAPHTGCRIYTTQGILAETIPAVENYQTVRLPAGIYIVVTDNMTTPIKVVVK